MKYFEDLIVFCTFTSALWAAWKWYASSQVKIELGYIYPGMSGGETFKRNNFQALRQPEPGDPELQRMNEISATWSAMNEASALNAVAALWTGVSVALGGFASIIGAFSH